MVLGIQLVRSEFALLTSVKEKAILFNLADVLLTWSTDSSLPLSSFQYTQKRIKSREHGNAMRKRLFNPPEESEK